ncbi:hypothetical protein PRZ48_009054 [Zasmidium cellare]|uniref:Protein kinase domain-containing protein n=1 Tax=Zasmidium cellare TaxID=395010 RepID=A0ABR0EHA8_ZASCE|nr:hypothetical protein PRZ48_009054 [Zasmidium cellare]
MLIPGTEITAQNVLMETTDDAVFRRIEDAENSDPTVPIEDDGYPVYRSRGQPLSLLELTLDPVLTDFGSSRSAATANDDWWMPDTHRAPEIVMGLPWNDKVDVWSIGIMALELLEGRNLFTPIDMTHNQYVLPLAVSQYMGYMGLPPKWMIEQSKNPVIKTFFDESGK